MKKQTIIIIGLVILFVGLVVGYFIGYEIGFEKSTAQTQLSNAQCEQEAENKAREALKPKYGDPVSKEFVLGSPHYKELLQECLTSSQQ